MSSLALSGEDMQADFDPEQYDETMKRMFDEDYYEEEGEEEEEKPVFSDDEELEGEEEDVGCDGDVLVCRRLPME